MSGHLISHCNARVMLSFTNRWSPSLLPGHRRNRRIGSASPQVDAGQLAGVTAISPSCAGRGARWAATHDEREVTHGERAFRGANTSTRQTAATIVCLRKYQEQVRFRRCRGRWQSSCRPVGAQDGLTFCCGGCRRITDLTVGVRRTVQCTGVVVSSRAPTGAGKSDSVRGQIRECRETIAFIRHRRRCAATRIGDSNTRRQ